jgi:sensor histidine kinase YesM
MTPIFVKKNTNPLNWKTALAFSVVIAFLASVSSMFAMINSERFVGRDMGNILITSAKFLIVNIVILFLLYTFAFKMIQLPLKFHIRAVIIILGVFLLLFGIVMIHFLVVDIAEESRVGVHRMPILLQLFSNFFAAIIIWLSTSQLHINYLKEQTIVENERLITENIRNRYEALKNQIDPHFLFNSLNTLNGLIRLDSNRAHEYVEKLSSVFRYTIQNKDITTLYDEMEFTGSYAYLIKIRYGENFRIDTAISEKYLSYKIMPISVQLLIENAIKHNVISAKYPLTVSIFTTEKETIVVENNIRAKESTTVPSGIGLANLCERYKLLFQEEVIISNAGSVFRVEIPLIK